MPAIEDDLIMQFLFAAAHTSQPALWTAVSFFWGSRDMLFAGSILISSVAIVLFISFLPS
jgi:hypothetical protein